MPEEAKLPGLARDPLDGEFLRTHAAGFAYPGRGQSGRIDRECDRALFAFAVATAGAHQRIGQRSSLRRRHRLATIARLAPTPRAAGRTTGRVRAPGHGRACAQRDRRRVNRNRQGGGPLAATAAAVTAPAPSENRRNHHQDGTEEYDWLGVHGVFPEARLEGQGCSNGEFGQAPKRFNRDDTELPALAGVFRCRVAWAQPGNSRQARPGRRAPPAARPSPG